jgi:hypothetical protein
MVQDTAFLWDAAKRDRFAALVDDHKRKGISDDAVFEFEGGKFLLGYAKYLIEYLYSPRLAERTAAADVRSGVRRGSSAAQKSTVKPKRKVVKR